MPDHVVRYRAKDRSANAGEPVGGHDDEVATEARRHINNRRARIVVLHHERAYGLDPGAAQCSFHVAERRLSLNPRAAARRQGVIAANPFGP